MADQPVPVYKPNGPQIKYLRKRAGLSVDEVVAALAQLGIERHPDTIRRAERSGPCGFQLVNGIAEVLDVDPDEILVSGNA